MQLTHIHFSTAFGRRYIPIRRNTLKVRYLIPHRRAQNICVFMQNDRLLDSRLSLELIVYSSQCLGCEHMQLINANLLAVTLFCIL